MASLRILWLFAALLSAFELSFVLLLHAAIKASIEMVTKYFFKFADFEGDKNSTGQMYQ